MNTREIKVLDMGKNEHPHTAFFVQDVWCAYPRVKFTEAGMEVYEKSYWSPFIYAVGHVSGYYVTAFKSKTGAIRFTRWMAKHLPGLMPGEGFPEGWSKKEMFSAIIEFGGDDYWNEGY